MSSMIQMEDMRKNPFWYFWFDWLWPLHLQFSCQPKSSNHIILVSAHLILKLKMVLESSRLRESMVRNPFLYFECLTFGNPCDSSTSPRAKIKLVISEKFLKHGFSFLHPKSSIFFRIPIKVIFWLLNIKKPTPILEQPPWDRSEHLFKSWKRIGFQKNSKCWVHN